MRSKAKREREREKAESVLSNRRGGVKGRKIGFKEVGGGVEVEEISSTLFIDSDEACIKSDFSILSTRLSYRGSRLL